MLLLFKNVSNAQLSDIRDSNSLTIFCTADRIVNKDKEVFLYNILKG